MKTRRGASFVVVALMTLGVLLTAQPAGAQVQEGSGCCQFEGDEPGCWFPSTAEPCAKLDGKFLEGEKCDAEAKYCSGYDKKGSGSKDSDKGSR